MYVIKEFACTGVRQEDKSFFAETDIDNEQILKFWCNATLIFIKWWAKIYAKLKLKKNYNIFEGNISVKNVK